MHRVVVPLLILLTATFVDPLNVFAEQNILGIPETVGSQIDTDVPPYRIKNSILYCYDNSTRSFEPSNERWGLARRFNRSRKLEKRIDRTFKRCLDLNTLSVGKCNRRLERFLGIIARVKKACEIDTATN